MIRRVIERDFAEVIVLLNQLSPYPVNPDLEVLRAKIREIEACEHVRVFGYEIEEKIVGMCTIGRIEGLSRDCRPFAVIENVVVHESVRRKGIGTQLVCHAINQAERWHCYKVVLETGTKNEGKLGFYEKCGLVRGDKTAFIKRFR
jgi:GNAT superfamily N-acetyltransferase